MKNKINLLLIAAGLQFASCQLVNVTDVEPMYLLDENSGLNTIEKNQTALYGTYGLLKSGLEIIDYIPGNASLLGGTMIPAANNITSGTMYQNNDVLPTDYSLSAIYTKLYQVINNSNHIIYRASAVETNDIRKNQLIGEARVLRAWAHFNLLRFHGQFWDKNSEWGIVVRNTPVNDATPIARSGVQNAYDLIFEDLNYAVENAPDFNNTFFASKEAARALRAKVYLYAKQYDKAAEDALSIINNNNFQLETTFAEVFSKKTIGTKEVIFQTPFDDKNDRNNKAFIMRTYFLPSPLYTDSILKDDPRYPTAVVLSGTTKRNGKFNGAVFNGQTLTADTEYFLRLPEMYLIYAEAVLRNDASKTTESLAALNTVRDRAGLDPHTATDVPTILEYIRVEKMKELGAESGEEWFDYLRYHYEGNLNITDHRPGAIEQRRILPIPENTVLLSDGVIIQNPGY